MPIDILTMFFTDQKQWEEWLDENHKTSDAVWLKFAKKDSGIASIRYQEALESALCFGWIDSQVKKFDENFYIQKFSPRRRHSIWSKNNVLLVERLLREGKMKPAGMQEVGLAKKSGRWEAAYDSPKNVSIPKDFMTKLSHNKMALNFFKTLNKANIYSISWRLQTAKKPETREKRMQEIIEMLSNCKKFH